jgi:hypothetical protein
MGRRLRASGRLRSCGCWNSSPVEAMAVDISHVLFVDGGFCEDNKFLDSSKFLHLTMAGFREWELTTTRSNCDQARRRQSRSVTVCTMRRTSKTDNTRFETGMRHVAHNVPTVLPRSCILRNLSGTQRLLFVCLCSAVLSSVRFRHLRLPSAIAFPHMSRNHSGMQCYRSMTT